MYTLLFIETNYVGNSYETLYLISQHLQINDNRGKIRATENSYTNIYKK